jgi:hypothetical protein
VSGRLTARHFELYRLMWACAWPGNGGRPICSWGQEKLAAQLGVTSRTVRTLIADLREPGFDRRHPDVKPAGLRLGWLQVLPRERPGARNGGTLYGANRYVLQLDPAQVDEQERLHLPSSDRREAGYPQGDPPEGHSPRSDRREVPSSERHRREVPNEPVSAGQTEGKREPTSLSHLLQVEGDIPSPPPVPSARPESDDRAPLRSTASGSAARSAAQEPARDDGTVPVPVDWRAALGRAVPDNGERFESREDEVAAKRNRAAEAVAIARSLGEPDPEPCQDCPEGAAV